jgi:hypothetical protein
MNLRCAKAVQKKNFFARNLNIDRNLQPVEKKLVKTALTCLVAF